MSNVNFKDGKYFLQDGERGTLLLDARTPFFNRSRVHSHQFTPQGGVEFPLTNLVNVATQKIFKQTPESMSELITYLRIVARLLNKPQIHNVLRIGQWSPLEESLAEILPQFNPDIAEVVRAENLLAEIFPELYSDTIKFNFNLLKEFLIDLRLGNGAIVRVNRQYEILAKDWSNS